MSKIPRPSPRPLRELPLTDDEKSAVLPLNRRITRSRLKKDLANKHEENKKQEKITVRPKEETKPIKKQSRKVTIPNLSLPSTSKEPATSSGASVHRQCRTLNRSKTEPSIKLGHVSSQRNRKITTSHAKQAVDVQSEVHAVTPVPKNVSRPKQRLSFRDKKPSKLEDSKKDPVSSKTKAKVGSEQVASVHLKCKRAGSFKVATRDLSIEPNRIMNRSKTESSINLGNVKKGKRGEQKTLSSQIKQKITKIGEERDKLVAEPISELLRKQDNMLSNLAVNLRKDLDVQEMFHSPKEVPHGGMRFVGRTRNRRSIKFAVPKERSPSTQ